ncbi:MAG TPA: hypothetical protein VD907_06100 [Verrucomicrobiae bacterium]|nr:hypothetical protein [Verrucomicrobiae bacterium]
MQLVEADLKLFDNGYFMIHDQKFKIMIVGRIDRLALRDDPQYGPVVDIFYQWRASTIHSDEWPKHFERPRHSASPDMILLSHNQFSWGENGQLMYFDPTSGALGIFSRPNDPIFDETVVPERFRSY